MNGKKVLIVAGEASGDLHGASLVREMLKIDGNIHFWGVGGDGMRDAGVNLITHSSDIAVMGVTEVISKLGFILSVRKKITESFRNEPPALVILIDYPEFNLSIARSAKKCGIPVLYYISPQVWAWRRRRVYSIARCVDRLAVILPFEKECYKDVSLDVRFVGHPLLDVVKRKYVREEALRRFGLAEKGDIVALLPGSRMAEVRRLLPDMLEAAVLLAKEYPSLRFVLPLAPTIPRDFVESFVNGYNVTVTITENEAYDTVGIADVAIAASGTATLETAILETPMIIIYKVSLLSYVLGRIFINVKHIGLVNIISGKTVVPEFIQDKVRPDVMAEEVSKILADRELREDMKREMRAAREKLGEAGAAKKTAIMACDMMST